LIEINHRGQFGRIRRDVRVYDKLNTHCRCFFFIRQPVWLNQLPVLCNLYTKYDLAI
jgi:hypothetical protein